MALEFKPGAFNNFEPPKARGFGTAVMQDSLFALTNILRGFGGGGILSAPQSEPNKVPNLGEHKDDPRPYHVKEIAPASTPTASSAPPNHPFQVYTPDNKLEGAEVIQMHVVKKRGEKWIIVDSATEISTRGRGSVWMFNAEKGDFAHGSQVLVELANGKSCRFDVNKILP